MPFLKKFLFIRINTAQLSRKLYEMTPQRHQFQNVPSSSNANMAVLSPRRIIEIIDNIKYLLIMFVSEGINKICFVIRLLTMRLR